MNDDTRTAPKPAAPCRYPGCVENVAERCPHWMAGACDGVRAVKDSLTVDAPAAPVAQGEPIATLHDDGYWSFPAGRDPLRPKGQPALDRLDVYAPTKRQAEGNIAADVLSHLDGLGDDAAAHIWPDDLARCMTSECVVKVSSVRMGAPGMKTVPLFSRAQVMDAMNRAIDAPSPTPAPAAPVAPAGLLMRAAMALEVSGNEWRKTDPNLRVELAAACAPAAPVAQGEPVAWPSTPDEVRAFVGSDFCEVKYAGKFDDDKEREPWIDPPAHEDDLYTLTAHDLLSAFSNWVDAATAAPVAQPVSEPSKAVQPLTDEQIDAGRRAPWGFDLDPFTAGVRFAERACAEAWGIKLNGIGQGNA